MTRHSYHEREYVFGQVMLKLRLHEHAQYEIRAYAEAILPMAAYVAPIAMRLYDKHVLKTGVFDV